LIFGRKSAKLTIVKNKERWSKMTTLEKINVGKMLGISAQLENRIIHDFNNGGCKSTYGLNTRQRKILIGILFSANAPKCYCVNCL
jgi:hypothetical protein